MKYAIIVKCNNVTFLSGFTNNPIDKKWNYKNDPKFPYHKYTVLLRELDNLSIVLEGDAEIYLS